MVAFQNQSRPLNYEKSGTDQAIQSGQNPKSFYEPSQSLHRALLHFKILQVRLSFFEPLSISLINTRFSTLPYESFLHAGFDYLENPLSSQI